MEHSGVGRENRHSRMGIASLVLGVLAILAILVPIIVTPFLAAPLIGDPQSFDPATVDQDSPVFAAIALLGLVFLASVPLSLAGLGLGIAGMVQGRRKRLFAVIGTVLSALVVLGFVLLLLLGLAFGGGL